MITIEQFSFANKVTLSPSVSDADAVEAFNAMQRGCDVLHTMRHAHVEAILKANPFARVGFMPCRLGYVLRMRSYEAKCSDITGASDC